MEISEIAQPGEFHLPLQGWLCIMCDDFDFETMPGFSCETWIQDAIAPPHMFILREQLMEAGKNEDFLLDHKKVKSCWDSWAIYEARFELQLSKRVLLEFTTYVHFAVFTSQSAALADLAANYSGNQLLLELAQDLQLGGEAKALLAGTGNVTALVAAAEAGSHPRAALINQLHVWPS